MCIILYVSVRVLCSNLALVVQLDVKCYVEFTSYFYGLRHKTEKYH